ncbi:MAG: 23S rRNA (pseudouridine(1915)-N(3))-methyltransferase RlmH [Pirellulaceae bacterium]
MLSLTLYCSSYLLCCVLRLDFMQLCVVLIGKPRPSEFGAVIDLYLARIRKLVDCEVISLRGERIDRRRPEEIKSAEGRKVLSTLRPDDWLAVCDERGKSLKTADLAHIMDEAFSAGPRFAGKKRLVVLVGGALGVSSEVRKRADALWALSGLTLAESVARVVLVEGIYRAITVMKGHPYHNE